MTDEANNSARQAEEHYVAPWARHRPGVRPWTTALIFLLLICAVFLVVIVAS